MSKRIKSICLDEEVYESIEEQRKKYKFDLSAWVNDTYKLSFLSVEGIVKLIEQKYQEAEELKNKLNLAKEKLLEIGLILNRNEINFILKIPHLIKEGKEWSPILHRFNIEFNRHLKLIELQQLVYEYDEERKKALVDKIKYFQSKK